MTPRGQIEGNYPNITEVLAVHTLQILMTQDKYVFIEVFAMKWVRRNVIVEGAGTRKKLERAR